jgi:hypothetical protein
MDDHTRAWASHHITNDLFAKPELAREAPPISCFCAAKNTIGSKVWIRLGDQQTQ